MKEKVTISLVEHLPMPLIYLASAEDLAHWYVGELQWAWEQGHRQLAISCFDTASMGFDVTEAAHTVLKAVADFLISHEDVETLDIFCGSEEAFRAYGCAMDPPCQPL